MGLGIACAWPLGLCSLPLGGSLDGYGLGKDHRWIVIPKVILAYVHELRLSIINLLFSQPYCFHGLKS
jgi:hypothetical protein